MKPIILAALLTSTTVLGWTQARIAALDPDGLLQISEIPSAMAMGHSRNTLPVVTGFPLMVEADQSFKNFRNVCLHDLDDDGKAEIIFASGNELYVYRESEKLWSASLSGLARFPAAVADLDRDGNDEIVVTTGFNDDPGMVYVFDQSGMVKPNWPRRFGSHWKVLSPAIGDLDGDEDLEIVFGDIQGSEGAIYAVHHDGEMLTGEWPVRLPNIPAVTASIGDIDGDQASEIVICTTREVYVLDSDGQVKTGWPYDLSGTKYSFQSPVLTDLDGDGNLEILGTGHGDRPVYYALDHQGRTVPGWPLAIPDGSWSFHPPSVFAYQNEVHIINARPGGTDVREAIFARKIDGSLRDHYPIAMQGGHEGISVLADLDGDTDPDLIVSSNVINDKGEGLIYAFDYVSGLALNGFPIAQPGWTYMNGATIGDINGDGQLEMVTLSYTENDAGTPDTTFVFAYQLEGNTQDVWWSTYKGSNDRTGRVFFDEITSVKFRDDAFISVYPNPTDERINLKGSVNRFDRVVLRRVDGAIVLTSPAQKEIELGSVPAGLYFLVLERDDESQALKVLIQR